MIESYFELFVIPNAYLELYADFILETTNEAIEEASEYPKNLDFKYFNIDGSVLGDAIIVRCQKEEEVFTLLEKLQKYSHLLSERMEQKIGFAYALDKKKNEDWINQYRLGITPIECNGFYIHPSWYPKKENVINIMIDPALAFGSGHHATTSMCIDFLSKLSLQEKTLLDVGCGSGILSLVAKKNGAIVHMCDTDPLAVKESLKNFALNHESIDKIWEGSIDKSEGGYDIIVANILADVIKILYNDFNRALKSGSVLILSGILEKYKDSVIDKFKNFELQEARLQDEWVALKMIKK
ncbi:50S ribosomal protein L11 methyltransferase [Helicobacter sp. faydin-H20]|uniref:50S ribosomal protein L11 methyltransferase n=1 Tax=Helicobacter anatolicus TaxID=2905874 RepID=UPI001E2BCCE6|nr:50S ribosomal protein L11 methyltransferase [Helicobacter anatolicus]MCE3036736.1 50S ribosomal protein L11 methyltransferase [Helicobacter anatolicus]